MRANVHPNGRRQGFRLPCDPLRIPENLTNRSFVMASLCGAFQMNKRVLEREAFSSFSSSFSSAIMVLISDDATTWGDTSVGHSLCLEIIQAPIGFLLFSP